MEYFFLSLCVVAFWIGGSSGQGKLTIKQSPNPVGSKGNVTLTCSGASIPPRDLTWKYSNGEEVDVNNTLGVIKLILDTESSLVLNMENFTSEATVSCGGEVEDKKPRQNFSICVSWGIIHPPENITIHEGDDGPKSMNCKVVQDCETFRNPWVDEKGKKVENNTKKGINVTSNLVPGTSTVVEWTLAFTKLSIEELPNGTYTCRVPNDTANATLKMAESWIVRPPPSVTTVSKVDSDKTVSCLVAEDGMEPPNPWYDQDGGPVKNVNGIAVTPSSLPGIGTVHIVEWKLTFTNPLEHVIPNTGVNYTCKGSHSNATATLKWANSRTINIRLQDLIWPMGSTDPRSMICIVVGDYNSSIVNPWTHKGVPVVTNSVVTVEKPLFEPDLVVYQLTFRNVTDEDTGVYTCAVSDDENSTAALIWETSGNDQSTTNEMSSSRPIPTSSLEPLPSIPDEEPPPPTPAPSAESTSAPPPTPTPPAVLPTNSTVIIPDVPSPSPNTTSIAVQPPPPSPEPTSVPSTPVGILGIAITVVVLVILCGAVYLVYWKRHMLRDWLMDKDVVKVIKKQKKGKGYKYSKLPRDISTSMKHLE